MIILEVSSILMCDTKYGTGAQGTKCFALLSITKLLQNGQSKGEVLAAVYKCGLKNRVAKTYV